MSWKHLNQENLVQLLQLLKAEFDVKVDKVEGFGLSSNDFTTALKTKLEGIEEGANKYTHATHTAQSLALWKVQIDAEGHVAGVQAVSKDDITGLGIPGQDTTYVVATQTADGLMAAADKKKLDGIAEGANNYTHAVHDAHASGFYKITVDAEGHVSAVAAVTKSDLATLLGEATLTEAGLMSAADKTKLEGIAAGAQVNVIEEIQVNGEAQAIDGKSINITVPTGDLAQLDEVTEDDLAPALKEKVNAASEGNHSHNNKALLDTYTQTEENLADAVAKKHAHANAEELDKIAIGDKAKWDAAQANAEATAAAALSAAKTELEGKITEGDNAAKTYAEEKASAAETAAKSHAETKASEAQAAAKTYTDEQIAAKIASAYKAAGTYAYADLPTPSAETEGYVYNISDAFTTDEDFVEGAGKTYGIGTNLVVVEVSEGVFKYDVLAMSFDGFVQEADIEEFTSDEITTIWNGVFTE